MEEAAEVQKAAAKMLRFGPSPVDPAMIPNREALARELHDFKILWKMLIEQGMLGEYPKFGKMVTKQATINTWISLRR